MNTAFIDHTGETFGRLLVLNRAENSHDGRVQFDCQCACGNLTTVLAGHLRRRVTRSCSCLARELAASRMRAMNLVKRGRGDEYFEQAPDRTSSTVDRSRE
jgi:hypothetical protein